MKVHSPIVRHNTVQQKSPRHFPVEESKTDVTRS